MPFISGGGSSGGGGAVTQGTIPWVVSANGGTFAVTQSGAWNVGQSGAWNVGQSGAPWRVNANANDFADGSIVGIGLLSDAAWVSGNGSVISILKGIFGKLAGTLTATVSGAVNATLQAGTAVAGAVGLAALAGNGASVNRLASSAATTNATNVKGSAGTILAIIGALNTNAAVRYIHLYDKATAPIPGTDTPIVTIALPPSNGGRETSIPIGIKCTLGIGFALTTDAAAGNNAVAAGDIVGLNISYV